MLLGQCRELVYCNGTMPILHRSKMFGQLSGQSFGLPALSLPVLRGPQGLPLALQLIGQTHDDARLLRTARALLEQLSGKSGSRRRRKAQA